MSILENVLKEELERLEKNIASYEKMLENFPKGSIFIRKMYNQSFAYRKFKNNGKVISEYLGNIKNDNVIKEIEKSKEYRRLYNNLVVSKNEYEKLKKAVKVYDK